MYVESPLAFTRIRLNTVELLLDTYGPSTSVDQDGDASMEAPETAGAHKDYDVLIRCTDGMEINFATRVSALSHCLVSLKYDLRDTAGLLD